MMTVLTGNSNRDNDKNSENKIDINDDGLNDDLLSVA